MSELAGPGSGNVSEVMCGSVVSVGPDDRCSDIADVLYNRGISAVPVVGPSNQLLGVVSGADLLRAAIPELDTPAADSAVTTQARASDVMNRQPVTVAPSASVREAAEVMRRQQLRWLPVVQDGRLVGVVSRSDVLRVLTPADEQVCADVLAALAGTLGREACDAIHAAVRRGVVTLTGRLPLWSDTRQAVRAASLVDGVIAVHDELSFEQPEPPRRTAAELLG
jgi:CBS domain-containing protein